MKYNSHLLEIYEKSFRENSSLPALSEYGAPDDQTLTYLDFARRIARMHLFFDEIGLKKGDKIALLGKNNASWVCYFMAAVTYGATIVPILQDFSGPDAAHIINHSEAKLLFAGDSNWESMEGAELPGIRAAISLDTRRVLYEADQDGRVAKIVKNLSRKFRSRYKEGFTPENISYPRIDRSHVAVLNYTSGTTGFSKGVMLTLDNLAGNVEFGMQQNLHTKGSRCLSFLPLAHAYGCAFDMLTPLAVGSHITLFGKVPTPRLLLRALAEVKPHLVICVPLILEKIYKKQIVPMIEKRPLRWVLKVPGLDSVVYSKIRNRLNEAFGENFVEVIVGGAPLNAEVEAFLKKIGFRFTVGYGMTECGPLISYTPWEKFVAGSSGRVLPNMEAKIMSDDPQRIPGEICVRGQNVMKGYFKNREATEAVLDKDGWLHTGDMGTIDADTGTLFIKGRSKTMILSPTGQNIYPEEIEAKLNNMPYVGESLVVERGAGLTALVYPDFEQADRDSLSSVELEKIFNASLPEFNKLVAPYERISKIQLVPVEFEKTPKKSIKRFLYS